MSWFQRVEHRLGRYAIPGMVRILVGFNALVFLLQWANPLFVELLTLNADAVRHGQVWRLVTWLFIPPSINPIFIIFALMFYWLMGDGLEEAWGAFRLNVFLLIGFLGTTASAFLFGGELSNSMLYLSLLFAFATLYPDFTILLFLILPVKIKWVAALSAVLVGVSFLQGNIGDKISILLLLGNYLIFFLPGFIQHTRHRTEVMARREKFDSALPDPAEPMHRCSVCDRSDVSNPHLDFRVGDDGRDYCIEHLPTKLKP